MFIKLLKYDLKSMLKTMLPLWITVIIVGSAIGLCLNFGGYETMMPGFSAIMYPMEFLLIVLFAIFIAIIVCNILIVIQRFWNGLLKEEGYLMFTLPVSPRQLIFSKLCSALIVTCLSGLSAFFVVALIMILSPDGSLKDLIDQMGEFISFFATGNTRMVILVAANIVISLFAMIYRLYACMAIGQLSNRNRFIASFIAYIGLSVVIGTMVTSITTFIVRFTDSFIGLAVYDLIANIIIVIIYHAIVEYILTTHLNLE